MVEAKGIFYSYGERRALADLSFTVPKGSLFGVLGPNGSGKSTLFQLLSTLRSLQQGELRIEGESVAQRATEVRKKIAVVFQFPALDVQLTVEENLRFQGSFYGLAGAHLKRSIEQVLTQFGLTERRRDRVRALSGGLKRRVELAKALLASPSLLLLDEPTTGLDVAARREMWALLRQLQTERQLTIMVTTHLLEEAEGCSQVLLLNEGRKVEQGTPSELKAKLGGDRIRLAGSDLPRLQEAIVNQFGLASDVIDGEIHLEIANGHEFIPRLVVALGGAVSAVRLNKPTLEDVFIKFTGKGYDESGPKGEVVPVWRQKRKRE